MTWLIILVVLCILLRPLVVVISPPEINVQVNESSWPPWEPWDPLAYTDEERYGKPSPDTWP